MSSTLAINFSLRQNKAIERAITFDALRIAVIEIGKNPVYVGPRIGVVPRLSARSQIAWY